MIQFINNNLSVPKLSTKEKQWIVKFHNILKDCPERLELATIGGNELRIVDKYGANKSDMYDGACFRDGIVLCVLFEIPVFHGISG